ncbi:hydrolase [Methanocella sp. CWC-04]|uniref:Hydrolase n=1 Tax=Methanooceanicella nereidis TaxID=2052831 RepID=A0AAP2RC27_9EURY|nr:cyclase family protein [Methanocella sp. CWC-04]MCD1293537.1 hydrolase [Methanocella sp. CWC-04]
MRIVDLTHTIHPEMPVFPGTEQPVITKTNTLEKDGFCEVIISMYSHTGTHIDAPAHILENGPTLDKLDVGHFIGSATILDLSNLETKTISVDDLKNYEGRIGRSDFIIIKTGWGKHWGDKKYFDVFPSLSVEAAEWLAKFDLKGIGIDAISIDDINSTTFSVHKTFFRKNMVVIENLTNLDSIKKEFFTLSILPLKTKDADGSPVRAIAMVDEQR